MTLQTEFVDQTRAGEWFATGKMKLQRLTQQSLKTGSMCQYQAVVSDLIWLKKILGGSMLRRKTPEKASLSPPARLAR
ncbi:MAG: hypothetical protein HYZ65_11285 [Burkholderiales bacterium]|nr:hypothetical protein [Burkholderiales bacterium]